MPFMMNIRKTIFKMLFLFSSEIVVFILAIHATNIRCRKFAISQNKREEHTVTDR
jgi:hypothetical protein